MKELRKASAQTTKDFARLVKTLTKDIAKGHVNAAFVSGFMESSTGFITSWNGLSDGHIADYAKGWDAAGGRTYTFKNGRAKRKKA